MKKHLNYLKVLLLVGCIAALGGSVSAQTYCSPSFTYGCSNGATLNRFYTTGAIYNIYNLNTDCSGYGVADYTGISATAAPGMTIGVAGEVTKYSGGVKVWIDWNEDGDFDDTDENVWSSSGYVYSGSTFSGSFTVPATATAGAKRLRVRVVESSTSFTPCSSASYGETEDYTFNVITGPACSDASITSVTASGPDPICAGIPFFVTATITELATGITQQWQSRNPSGTGTWTNITGATSSPYYAATGLAGGAGDTDYRLIVTCTATGENDTSNVVTVVANPPSSCYCTPSSGGLSTYGCSDWRIDNFVTTGGVSNISNLNSNCAGSSMYGNYTSMLASQYRGSTVNYDIKLEYPYGSYTGNVMMWIDWDQSGTFDADEVVYSNMEAPANTTLSGVFEVPDDAAEGVTRIRIKTTMYNDFTDASACTIGSWDYTEVEDYAFEVFVPDPCSSVPMTAVSINGPEGVCAGSESFTLTVTGTPIASGLTKVWEKRSPAGSGTWTTIAGATMSMLNVSSISEETEYRFTVTCTETGASSSATWTVGMNPPTECYCIPITYACTWYQISDFETTGATVNISNLGSGCGGSDGSSAGGYSDFTDMNATAFQGTMVDYYIGLNTEWSSVRMWIDWNQDGYFTSDEIVHNPSPDGYSPMENSGSFEVPYDAVPGTTGLRIRSWSDWGSDYYDACMMLTWYDGETEDYTFTVVEPPPCNEVPFTGLTITGPSSVCAGYAFTISSTGTPVATGITRIWQSKTAGGSWTTISGVTSLAYNCTDGIYEETEYRYINICTLTGLSDTSNVLKVGMNNPTECYCEAVVRYAYDMYYYTWSEYKIKDVILNGDTDTLENLNTPFEFTGDYGDYGGYKDYTSDDSLGIPDLTQTGTYTGQVKVRDPYGDLAVRIWIDYNDDGVFSSDESVYASPTYPPGISSGSPANFSMTIPADATPGLHRMRVRAAYLWDFYYGEMDPCALYNYGHTQDYMVLVKELLPCSEVVFPTSVTAYSSPPNVCLTGDVTLRLGANMPLAAGVTYQWKSSSTEDGTYADAAAPTTAFEGPVTTVAGVSDDTYFRCYILCDGEPILISDAVYVQSVNLADVSITMEDGQVCGSGPVTLTGSTTEGSIFWYEEAEGGSPIYMGDEFVTPSLTTDKTYYATGGAYGATDGVVGTGSSTSYYYSYGLFQPYYGAKTVQYMYTKAELNEAGITMGGDIESIAFNLASLPSHILNDYTIKIKTVTTGPPMSWQSSGFTTVYGPATFDPETTGWQVFPFSTPFEWNGIDNIIVQICFNVEPMPGGIWSGSGGTHKYTTKSGQSMYYTVGEASSTSYCSSTWGYTNSYNELPNAKFYIPGCETERVPVTASVRPYPAPVNIGADEIVCKDPEGGRTLDVGPLPETYTRLWNTGETEQSIRITESGTYSIIVANEYGCEVYDTVTKTLLEIPNVELGDNMTVCEGGSIVLDAGPDGAYYMWNTGATTRTLEAYSEGTYNVLVENSAGCISLDTITLVFEGHMPSIGSIITTNLGSHSFNFEPILVNEYVIAYEWDFGDGSPISESSNPTHTYAAPGSYTVTLTVYSSCGQKTYTTTTHILGVDNANLDDNSVALYPNPAKDIATIESKGNLKMKTVTVTNVLGQVMYQDVASAETKHQLDLSGYASGLYTVRIETDKGFIIRKFEIVK